MLLPNPDYWKFKVVVGQLQTDTLVYRRIRVVWQNLKLTIDLDLDESWFLSKGSNINAVDCPEAIKLLFPSGSLESMAADLEHIPGDHYYYVLGRRQSETYLKEKPTDVRPYLDYD